MYRNIEIHKAKDGNYNLKVDKRYIYSRYFPLEEAGKFIEANKELYLDKKVVVVYGVGLGYHVKELLKRISNSTKVYLFDLDMEIIKISRELGLLEEIENDKRVELILGNDKKFYERFSEKIYLVEDIFIYEPLLKSLPSEYEEFKEVIKSFYIAKINIKRYAHIAKENEIINIKNNYKCIDEFLKNFHIKNEVVVVACAGPSLEKDLKVMKEKREHIKIFAVGKALDILMRNKIKPDMITVLDPNEIVYEQIKGYENLDIPICFLSTASRWVTKAYKGPKYIFFNKPCEYNKSNIIVKTGKTVSVPTIDLAIKAGAKKVILCGQDLAFVNDKLHVGDIENVEKSVFYKSVLGVDGTYLNTTSGMLEFKKNIEELITENKDIEFINSSKGAKIKGTIEKELHSCI